MRAVRNVLGNVYKNLWYEQHEQLDSGGGGALSQGGMTETFTDTLYSRAKTSSSRSSPKSRLFSSETADKFARDRRQVAALSRPFCTGLAQLGP